MKTYFRNLFLFVAGFWHFHELTFKPGWSATSVRWWLAYLVDYGICVVFLAGPVSSISRYAQMHRTGWFWDRLLDELERLDTQHGQRSGPVLWASEEPPLWVRVAVPSAWLVLALL